MVNNIPVCWSICLIESNQVGQSLAYGFSAPIGLLYDRYGVPTTAMSFCQCQWSKATLKQESRTFDQVGEPHIVQCQVYVNVLIMSFCPCLLYFIVLISCSSAMGQ